MKPKGTFTVVELGPDSYRVTGTKTDGERVRKNFSGAHAEAKAKDEKRALETEAFNGQERLCSTWLTPEQLQGAETAYGKVKTPAELLGAVDYWLDHGKTVAVAKSPRIKKAAMAFEDWLDKSERLRDRTKDNLRVRVTMFALYAGVYNVADVTPEHIQKYLDDRKGVSAETVHNDKRAISRFFSWCKERPRRWLRLNPCHEVKVERGDKPAPAILTVERCEKLLRAAESYKEGRLVRYTALCLFGKLRPYEAMRLKPEQINLADNEIRLEKSQTKTKRPRVVTIDPTLKAWLKAYPGEVFPSNWRRDFDKVKEIAGFTEPWIEDILRHTGISHFFRKCGSYGVTAEESGNSEAIIKQHYQSRVTSEETKQFYAIMPARKRKSRKIVDFPKESAEKNGTTTPNLTTRQKSLRMDG